MTEGLKNIQIHGYICTIADILEYKVNKIMLNNKERKKLTLPSFGIIIMISYCKFWFTVIYILI